MKRNNPLEKADCSVGACFGIPRVCIWDHHCNRCGFAQWLEEAPSGIDEMAGEERRPMAYAEAA